MCYTGEMLIEFVLCLFVYFAGERLKASQDDLVTVVNASEAVARADDDED